MSKVNTTILFLLILLNWFIHIVGCGISVACITIIFLFKKKSFREKVVFGLLISVIAILTFSFGLKAIFAMTPKFESFEALWSCFKNLFPLICYGNDELKPVFYFQLLIMVLIPISIYFFIKKEEKSNGFFLLACTGFLLLLFFIMPTTFLSGMFINYRILFCFTMFSCIFIEANLPKHSSIFLLPLVLVIVLKKNEIYKPIISNYSKEVENIVGIAQDVKPGTSAVFLNYSDNWLHYNIGLYPSFCNKLVVLDNLEAMSPNSIIRWREEKTLGPDLGTVLGSNKPLLKLDYEKRSHTKIGAIIRWCYTPSDDVDTKATINTINILFASKKSNDQAEIFLRK
ncbi:MAG: hypothetical protein H0W84_10245 [Bacteroidetes bacterium]|nr:hypothetical protein [Bacteroidota bacterium]